MIIPCIRPLFHIPTINAVVLEVNYSVRIPFSSWMRLETFRREGVHEKSRWRQDACGALLWHLLGLWQKLLRELGPYHGWIASFKKKVSGIPSLQCESLFIPWSIEGKTFWTTKWSERKALPVLVKTTNWSCWQGHVILVKVLLLFDAR